MVLNLLIALSLSQAGQTVPVQPKIVAAEVPPPIQLGSLPAGANLPLTAAQAARIALRRQSSISVAAAGFAAAKGRSAQTASGLNPSLSLSTGYSKADQLRGATSSTGGSTTSTGYNSSLNLNQLLFDFNVTRDQVRQADALARVQQQTLTKAQSDVVFQVKQAFYALRQADRLVEVAEANLRSREGQRALAQARLDSGLGAPPDVVRAQSAQDEAVLQLVQARSNVLLARVDLAQAIGVDPRTPLETAESEELTSPTDGIESLVGQALEHRPEILAVKDSVVAAGYAASVARKATTPALSANAGLTSRGETDPLATTRATYGLVITWGLFDGGLVRGRLKEAKANEEAAKKTFEGIVQAVIADVSTVFVNLKTAEQRVSLSASEVTNALEGVRLAEGRFRGAVGTFLEVMDAQAALVRAQTNQVNARSALQQQRAALYHALGKWEPG